MERVMRRGKIFFFFVGIFTCGIIAQTHAGVIVDKDGQSTGSMLAEIAKELVERSTSTNQVFNLNLSNLVLFMLLKAIVFSTNYVWNSDKTSRDVEKDNIVSEDEIALTLGYLIGDTCLYRAACEVPNTAKKYLEAVEMIIQTIKLIPETLPINTKYEKTIAEFRRAIKYGDVKRCPPEYTCKKDNIKNFLRPE